MNKEIQKFLVLGVLFVFPVLIYLFFASGKNNFSTLPILSESVAEITDWNTARDDSIQLKNKITILGFWGRDTDQKKGDALNLNQKIYKRFYEFNDFQFVMVLEEGQQQKVANLQNELTEGVGTDLIKWNFIFGDSLQIREFFGSLKTPLKLTEELSRPEVFIIDKEINLRGRDDDEDETILYGFNAQSVAEINNKMVDDVKVILAEYRRALKKYNKTSDK
ncbi:MAG: Uncharacterised protein [Flavobacteriaceae bacterium]|nr:MAG: Uncharacterised protein [Flavobacteriaceae bacterium]|tara:strand:+ start:4244 stop:4906 length:663 start_codon:yes stop_codon:yes gene_type:complete